MSENLAEYFAMIRDMSHISEKVLHERLRQHKRWGEQNHDCFTWLTILSEEVGEAAKACLEGNKEDLVPELIQIAAVAIAWIESIERGGLEGRPK